MNKDCKDNQIRNPLTNRCVNINGKISSKLIEKHKTNKIKLNAEDVIKLSKSGIVLNDNKSELLHLKDKWKITTPNLTNNKVSHKTKELIVQSIKKWRTKKNNESLKGYCKNKDGSLLHKPIVTLNANIEIVVRKINITSFSANLLDTPLLWKNEMIKLNVNYNNYRESTPKIDNSTSLSFLEAQVDWKWLNQMNNYVGDLSKSDIFNLKGYTYYGDVIVNNFLRNTLKKHNFIADIRGKSKWIYTYYPLFFPALEVLNKSNKDELINYITMPGFLDNVKTLYSFLKSGEKKDSDIYIYFIDNAYIFHFEKFWMIVIKKYCEILSKLFYSAPIIKKNMVVYRGIKNDYVMNGKKDNIYVTKCFVSTSLDYKLAMRFANPLTQCCFQRITLLPGTRVLLIAGISSFANEVEVLLNPDTHFYINNNDLELPYQFQENVCKKQQMIKVTDMVVVKT